MYLCNFLTVDRSLGSMSRKQHGAVRSG